MLQPAHLAQRRQSCSVHNQPSLCITNQAARPARGFISIHPHTPNHISVSGNGAYRQCCRPTRDHATASRQLHQQHPLLVHPAKNPAAHVIQNNPRAPTKPGGHAPATKLLKRRSHGSPALKEHQDMPRKVPCPQPSKQRTYVAVAASSPGCIEVVSGIQATCSRGHT